MFETPFQGFPSRRLGSGGEVVVVVGGEGGGEGGSGGGSGVGGVVGGG